jgi:hypothetical protein
VLVVVLGEEFVFFEGFDDIVRFGDCFEERDFGDGDLLELFFFHFNLILWVIILKVLVVDFLFILLITNQIRVIAFIIVKLSRHMNLLIKLWFRLLLRLIIITLRH